MVINSSRAQLYMLCKKKAFNYQHRGLKAPYTSMNLVDGGAFHEGVAVGLATKNWDAAQQTASVKLDAELPKAGFLAEEFYKADEHRNLVQRMIECYRENYAAEQFEVVQPECEFDVALPGTEHSCVFLHHWEKIVDSLAPIPYWIEQYGAPTPEAILEKRVMNHEQAWHAFGKFGDPNVYDTKSCFCYQPHRLKGKTDAVVLWQFAGSRGLWLLEHKTTAISGSRFWDQWLLAPQPTTYLYGIWKSLGIKPSGFIINAINKPSEDMVNNWNSRRKHGPPKAIEDYISYERQPFLRTTEDLLRVEAQYIGICNDWERRITTGDFPMENGPMSCMAYNHKCEYFSACLGHDAPQELEALWPRERDYIDIRLEELTKGAA